nr:hypothetical protein [uncultured Rhodopila sp.]
MTQSSAYGRATPDPPPNPASSILIVAENHPDCRRTDDIVPVTEGGAPAALGQEADAARGYAAASRAASTRLIYET